MARKRRAPTLAEVMVRRVGFRKTTAVLSFIVAWGIVYESLGRPPESIEEYAAWWKESRAKSFRDQQLFRLALPGEDTPDTDLRVRVGLRGDH